MERKENPTGHPCCSAPNSYTETLLRDVCCENTCLAPSTWTEAKHGGWGRTRSHREYYIPSTPRYTASHSVSFVDETRRTFRNSSTRVLLRPVLDETPDISILRLTPRERARDSSSIVAPLSLSWSFARSPLFGKTSCGWDCWHILVSRHRFSACQICLPPLLRLTRTIYDC